MIMFMVMVMLVMLRMMVMVLMELSLTVIEGYPIFSSKSFDKYGLCSVHQKFKTS